MDLNIRTGGWQPIATAPRDGTTIIVMHPDCGAFTMCWNPQTENGAFSPDTGMWEVPGEMTWCERDHTGEDVGPSHWKPFGH